MQEERDMDHCHARRTRPDTGGFGRTALRRILAGSGALIAAAACAALPAAASARPSATATAAAARGLQADTSAFRGVNWADPRDNYAADAVVPSGLSAQDDYATTYRKA